MAGLNVIALISGGKDSFFSILHCQANGHKVIALANLHPPSQREKGPVDDLESFMYQTVGHAVIPLYEQALGLPLFRQEILGDAVVKARDYGPAGAEDETENLLPLLRKVIAAHPEANAVSTGAILSDYQRTRVESVALRLGLTPLSYLWQWPSLPSHTESSLLKDMAAVGQDSRIIKVASGGMDDSFLWQNVADPRTISRLIRATQRFGSVGDGAVLGEGGEFETLAISGPAPLWKGRIEVQSEDINVMPGEAGSSSVRILNPKFVPIDTATSNMPALPNVLDQRFEHILEQLHSAGYSGSDGSIPDQEPSSHASKQASPNDVLVLANVVGDGASAAEQTASIMKKITLQLQHQQRSLDEVACSIITLRDMADFAVINPVYGSYFKRPNPPARVTIACADVLPSNSQLSITIAVAKGAREGLHVQSRSYWAPANIGPYSQAIKTTSTDSQSSIYVAGQIPLVPATMQLPRHLSSTQQDKFAHQSVLSLQHMHRIGVIMKVRQWTFGVVFIASNGLDGDALQQRARIVGHIWKAYHQPTSNDDFTDESEADGFDVWHLQHGTGAAPWHMPPKEDAEPTGEIPRLVIITADQLPRDADVEWIGHGKGCSGHQSVAPPHLSSLVNAFQHRILACPG